MANNTIKGAGDIYEKDLYGDLRKSGESVIPVLDAINDILKQQSKSTGKVINIEAKDIKSVEQINKGLEQTNKIFKEKVKIDKARLKEQERINQLERAQNENLVEAQKRVDDLRKVRTALNKAEKEEGANLADISAKRAQLNVELKAANTNLLNAQKETLGLTDANKQLEGEYEKQSKRLNALRKEYKNLFLQEGKVTDETQKLKREIDKLDRELKDVDASAGQFQRNVGNYPDTLDKAAKAITVVVGTALALKGAFDGIESSITSLEEGAEEVEEATAGWDGALSVLKSTLGSVALDATDFGEQVLKGNSDALEVLKNQVLTGLVPGLKVLKPELNETGEFFKRTEEATENFGDKLFGAVDAEREAARRAIEFRKVLRGLETQLARINGVIAEQNAIAGDSTRSFNEIEEAAVAAQKAEEQRAGILIAIAKEELSQINARLDARRKLGLEVEALLDAQRDAEIKLQETRNDLLVVQLENEKLLRENARDRFERELDFAIDAFDAVKTVNERRIADEQLNLEERRAIFDETVRLTDKSFQNQIKLVQEFTKQKIDLDALARESDEETIRTSLEKFNFDDVTLGRILEIIRERKLALQDLTDAQKDLNIVDQDAIDLRKDIAAQEEALGKITEESVEQSNLALEQLESDRINNQIENLRRRLFLAEEGSAEFLQIQNELNDALLDQQQRRIEKQVEADEEGAAQREEIQKALFSAIEKSVAAASDRRIKEIDEEVSATEQQQDRLRELAEKGVLGADQSLAAEEKKQAELERQKQQEIRKQELRTAGFKILSALLEQGKSPQEAIPEVGVLLGALPAVIEAIPAFYEGTEDTGKVRNALDKNGARISILHDNERVVDKKNNMRMGGVSNDEAARIVEGYNKGMLVDLHRHNQPNLDRAIQTNWQTNEQIMEKFQSFESSVVESNMAVKKAIDSKPVLTDLEYLKMFNTLVATVKQGNKTTKTSQKVKKLS